MNKDDTLNDWKWRFRNRFLPIKTGYGNPPEDITEPIIDFFDDILSRYEQQLVDKILKDSSCQTMKAVDDYELGEPEVVYTWQGTKEDLLAIITKE